ncbi:SNF2 family N-terminal domain-containing protein [Truncatella angustata]|uniref:SNF2 family N-terminal domain-containing protein n=1 Tax=Truncatella angustata TaxID=152316 RepID=A0A9P9A2K5_9PEZI|nr:SNF2 family N-terminal domain-containing protein [Truncatella angustata]KAH6658311.1 SNF2 family N-terminal domain-containing protein [Truncatella angustata]
MRNITLTLGRPANSAASAAATQSEPPRKRGRPKKSQVAVTVSESVSSVPSPALSVSDSGEYSTPATNYAVTPALSTTATQTRGKLSRSRLVVELPDDVADSDEEAPNTQGFASVASSRARRARRPTSYVVHDSEDDDLYSDSSPDAIVARRLQREEDNKADAATTLKASSFKLPSRRSKKNSVAKNADADDDDDEFMADVISNLETASNRKGKAKATTKPTVTKRKAIVEPSDDESFDEEDEFDNDAGLAIDNSEIDEDDDEPLSRSAPSRLSRSSPVRKKAKYLSPRASRGGTTETSIAMSDAEGFETPSDFSDNLSEDSEDNGEEGTGMQQLARTRRAFQRPRHKRRAKKERLRLEHYHPELVTMWEDLRSMPILKEGKAEQPTSISRQLKPFQLEGLAWMKKMEQLEWKGGILGDEMGLGKTIQAVSLIMSDYPAKNPTLVLVPPVALMQWTAEIESYTDGTLKTLVFHGTNSKAKDMTAKQLKEFNVIMMSYNTLESMYRRQEKGFQRKAGLYKVKSAVHSVKFHRVILDEAHSIKTRTTMTAKACFALNVEYRWCLTGTPLQNRIGEFFSLIRFLNISPFSSYLCKQCSCSSLEWAMNEDGRCKHCNHVSMRHVSVFNQELLNPIQKYGNQGHGKEAFKKLRLMTDRIMLRRLKKDHTDSMELPVKEVFVERQFFGEEENDFANSIMTSGQRKFDTYVAQGVMLNNYANIFGLIMQMRQVADHPDLILKKSGEGGQNVLQCCICDEPAEEAIRSKCKHDFCRACAKSYVNSQDQPDCPTCHIPLSIDLEQPEIEQDENLVKKSSIINRINMQKWTSSSKIELLVHELHSLRSDNTSHKSIIFSQFTTMLQLIEWRLRRAGITTVMLDGSMTPAQRQASINHFMTNVDVECFLVSLKAGGVALNLTEASRVFIVDPWWNPAAEWQSADRCHRIGQTRPCTIKRLCIEDSVESRIVMLQEKKANMIRSTINSDDAAMESLTPEDLQFLFRGS